MARLVLRFNDHSYIDYVSVLVLSILSEKGYPYFFKMADMV
jgi:hypothetical protein